MTLASSASALAEAYDIALVDLDGVVYLGPQPVVHAGDALRAARAGGMSLVFVTNNASRTPEAVAAHLVSLGIQASPTEVLTSAQTAVSLLRDVVPSGGRVLTVGGEGLRNAVRDEGYEIVTSADDRPQAVIQGFAPEVSWADLAEASYAVRSGAAFVATNMDLTQPKDRGIAPGNGTLVGVVVATTGVTPRSAGKPEPSMFWQAARERNAARPLVVGDRLDTDICGAQAAGYDALLVLTGVSSARDAVLAPPRMRPTYIGRDLTSLLVQHAAPTLTAGGWWECAGARARAERGALVIAGTSSDPLDAVRAACAAVWAAADEGSPVRESDVPEFQL